MTSKGEQWGPVTEYGTPTVTREPGVSIIEFDVVVDAKSEKPIRAWESIRLERAGNEIRMIGRGDTLAIPVEFIGIVFEEFAYLAPEGLAE